MELEFLAFELGSNLLRPHQLRCQLTLDLVLEVVEGCLSLFDVLSVLDPLDLELILPVLEILLGV